MRQLTDSERDAQKTSLREYWVERDGLLPKEQRAFEAGFIAAFDHSAAQIAALAAERDALRLEVERLRAVLNEIATSPEWEFNKQGQGDTNDVTDPKSC